jgi:VanZ family protein
MATIFVLSSIPGTSMPLKGLWRFDKLVHAGAFAVLAALIYRARPSLPLAIGATTAYGALDELHQRFTPMRSADPLDLAADFVGACVGAFAASMWVSFRESRSGASR